MTVADRVWKLVMAIATVCIDDIGLCRFCGARFCGPPEEELEPHREGCLFIEARELLPLLSAGAPASALEKILTHAEGRTGDEPRVSLAKIVQVCREVLTQRCLKANSNLAVASEAISGSDLPARLRALAGVLTTAIDNLWRDTARLDEGYVRLTESTARTIRRSLQDAAAALQGSETAPPSDLTFEVVVNGQPTHVTIAASANVRAVIEPALEQTGTLSRPESEWEVRLRDGGALFLDQPLAPFAGQRLWVNLRAGYAADAPAPAPRSRSRGAELIVAERERHLAIEGWTPEHDDGHTDGSLAGAAACLAVEGTDGDFQWVNYDDSWIAGLRDRHASTDRVRQLVIAGSLIASEIDRLLRARGEAELPR